MGKGDLRTRRGKLYRGTHGKTRAKGRKKKAQPVPAAAPRRPGAGLRPG